MTLSKSSPCPAVLSAAFIGAAALLCAFPTLAQTDTPRPIRERGFYVGGAVGGNFQEDNQFTGSGTNSTTSYLAGPAGLLSFGYALGNGFRFEIEPGYRYNDVDTINGGSAGGRTQIFTGMVNALYDFDMPAIFGLPLTPHIGAGAGWAHLWNRSSPHNGLTVTGQDDRPAFQAIAGAEYNLSPALKLGLDYRYLVANDATFRTSAGVASQAGDFNDHAIMLTLRYSFAAAEKPMAQPAVFTPAPPPPAPVPTPQANVPPPAYTVYFNFDRSDIEASAQPILERAAGDAKNGKVTRIAVTGYTDLAGSAEYNQRLSERRAAAVRAALVKLGVPDDEIATVGRGKNDPIVKTADGVREPRNRRVEIVLQAPGS